MTRRPARNHRQGIILAGSVSLVVAWGLALFTFATEVVNSVGDRPFTYCSNRPLPDVIVAEGAFEAILVRGSWSWFPVGIECQYQALSGLVVTVPPGLAASVSLTVALVLTVTLLLFIFLTTPPRERDAV